MNDSIDRYGKNKIITESTIINSWKSCKLIGEYLPDEQCVYAVSVNRSIVYIGSAVDLKARLWCCLGDNPISSILRDKQCPVYELTKTKGTTTCLRLGLFDVYNLVVHYKIWDGYSKDRFKLEYQLIKSIKPVLNVAGAYREPDYNPVQEFFKNYYASINDNQNAEYFLNYVMENISDKTQIIDAYALGELEGFIRALEDLNIEPGEIKKKVTAQIYDIDRLYYLLEKYSVLGAKKESL